MGCGRENLKEDVDAALDGAGTDAADYVHERMQIPSTISSSQFWTSYGPLLLIEPRASYKELLVAEDRKRQVLVLYRTL